MSKKLKLVAVSGGLQRPSRTLALVDTIVAQIADLVPLDVHVVELSEIAADVGVTLDRRKASAVVESHLRAIEGADALIVASPVFRASFTGLFKHLFDLVHQDALVDVPVLLAATGGSERHALVLEHQLRPLFSFFQARTLPIGVYASTHDFTGYEVTSAPLRERIALAAERAAPWLCARDESIAATAALTI
ncbi:FMN reductase [Trinickia dinghuensis]|uniref:FMN reductase n=1 Tax=Trinickia dinghuensis TaxID=2291023 RepID=A0A3D8JY99_9BURK|nr:FMN reductase [Trinickia dinghuensis]RDU98133.1 FMN reductase [Trinickia dinghuensis]